MKLQSLEEQWVSKFLKIDSRSKIGGIKPSFFMAKKELKKVFNLNSYEWWRNHRRVVSFGLFLSIFAYYLGIPFYKEAKVKDTCAKLNSSYQITGDEAMKKLNLEEIKNYNNRELANYYCERYLGIK